MRREFLALLFDPTSIEARELVDVLSDAASGDETWRPAPGTEGCRLWRSGHADLPIRVLSDGHGVLLGSAFPTARHAGARCLGSGAVDAHRLCREVWGPYVALLRNPRRDWRIFREPSGQIDVLTWRLAHGVAVAASTFVGLPLGFRPRGYGLDWDRIVTFLTVPVATTTESLFAAVQALGPGEQVVAGGGSPEAIWSPAQFVEPLAASPEELSTAFVELLDRCASALLAEHQAALFELSGGLDSSSLAASLVTTGDADRIATWLNLADPRPEADERRYAQSVADLHGFPLTIHERWPTGLDPERFSDLGNQTWPAIAGVDAERDLDAVHRLQTTGATAIVSGQGGDSIFFQSASPLLAGDLLRSQGLLRTVVDPRLAALARRSRKSVWRVLAEARRGIRTRASGVKNVNRLVKADVFDFASGAEHAWVRALADLDMTPGKRVHIRALATGQFNHTGSRRREKADLVYPYLAQPMMELALGVPTTTLTGGTSFRPFQRRTFADRLPPLVRDRRHKGEVSVYLARMMAESLDVLRSYLLNGVLVGSGILDRQRLAAVLDLDYLIQTAAGTDLAGAIAVEAWVRRWQTQMADAPGRFAR